MYQPELDYRAIRRRVEEELKRQKIRTQIGLLMGSIFGYVVLLLAGWGTYLSKVGQTITDISTKDDIASAMIMLSIGGLMVLFFQLIALIMNTKSGERQLRDRITSSIINEELLRLGMDEDESPREKAKRVMRLNDDGEIETQFVNETDDDSTRTTLNHCSSCLSVQIYRDWIADFVRTRSWRLHFMSDTSSVGA